ncbi:hypothetical protein F383_33997 [Gossypium arboreum]|uniref:Uncharacterized protein n=1 Tax=Gossypium arboreum TaxID=29729 RepID=A0A0B0N509_GOSAR|nr:hypothetical protein F383_33997 [Gossypium arboreum]
MPEYPATGRTYKTRTRNAKTCIT